MEERRQHQRYPVKLTASITPEVGQAQEAFVTDVSSEGIRLLLREKIQFGSTVSVALMLPDKQHPVSAHMTVRWNRPVYDQAPYAYAAGGEIHRDDSPAWESVVAYAQATQNP